MDRKLMKKLLLTLALIGLLIPSVSFGAIAFDNFVGMGTNPTTVSFTVGSNPGRIMFVACTHDRNAGDTVEYNGVAMTGLTSMTDNQNYLVTSYYLLNPASGANNITISSASNYWCAAASYSGVKQSAPTNIANSGMSSGGVTSASLGMTSTVDNSFAVGLNYTTNDTSGAVAFNATGDVTKRGVSGTANQTPKVMISDSNTPKTPAGAITISSTIGEAVRMGISGVILEPYVAPSGPTRRIKGVGVSR